MQFDLADGLLHVLEKHVTGQELEVISRRYLRIYETWSLTLALCEDTYTFTHNLAAVAIAVPTF